LAAPSLSRFIPVHTFSHMNAMTGLMAALLAIITDRILRNVDTHILQKLRIGEHIAPYFGHRITRTLKILRG
jgi:hypothetical protein